MSNLLKALKRAEQDRRHKLQQTDAPQPVAESEMMATSVGTSDERHNPLLGSGAELPAAVADPSLGISPTAMVVALALAIMLAGNLGYWLRGRAAVTSAENVSTNPAANAPMSQSASVPRALLGSDAMPLELQLDRRTDLAAAIAR